MNFLVVDDTKTMHILVTTFLKRAYTNCEITYASTGVEALKLVKVGNI